jgi:protein SCO1/2
VSLLDAQGRIYRQIYVQELQGKVLSEALKELLNDAPVAQTVRIADLINRVRILCTVYDPVTGTYRVQYGLLIEVAGGLSFALFMAWFFLAEWLDQRRSRLRRSPVLTTDSPHKKQAST